MSDKDISVQISPTSSIHPTSSPDRLGASLQLHEAAVNPKAVEQAVSTPKVFTPAPPLRPNVQDYIDIDRTLIALRAAT
jgi:hypothetical protein